MSIFECQACGFYSRHLTISEKKNESLNEEIESLKQENARLREALESISKRAIDLIVLSQDLYDDVSSLERGK